MEKHWGWNRKLIGILRKRRAEEPPVTPVRVAMGKLGTFKNLSGAVHECNQWIELWTNAIHILDGPCDIGDIEASTIDALFEETQETVDAATASICNQTGCFQVKIGADTNAFDCAQTGETHYVNLVRQVWFRCVAPL